MRKELGLGQLWVQSKGKGAAGLEVHLGGEGISLARLARDLHAHSTPHSRPRGDRRIRRGEETNSSEHGTGDNRVQKWPHTNFRGEGRRFSRLVGKS